MWPQKRRCRGRTSPIPYLFTKGGAPPPPPPPPLSLICVRRRGGEGGGAPHDVSWTLLGELSEFPTPSALKPTNYSPTRVQPVLSFNCTTQSGSSVNLVVCKCNSWQLWFNWLEPDMLWATWLQHKMFTLKEKKNPGSSGHSKNIQKQGTNKTMHFCQSFPPSPLRTQVVTYSEAMIPMDWNSRRVPSRIERYQAPIGKLWGQGLENHNVQKKCGQSDFNS